MKGVTMVTEFYTLFCQKDRPALCCAIPEDKPRPSFVEGEGWSFRGKVPDIEAPRGFRPMAARNASRMLGFYLFQTLDG